MITRYRPRPDLPPQRFFTVSGIVIVLLIVSALVILALTIAIALTQAQVNAQLEEQILALQQSTYSLQETVDDLMEVVGNTANLDSTQITHLDAALDQIDLSLEMLETGLEDLSVDVIPEALDESVSEQPSTTEGMFLTAAWLVAILSIITAMGAGLLFNLLSGRRRLR
ncbi:MAG: hypothetical protein NZM00_04040 [Anaerolinea sp.]|nr:hypothetical protein [Anaerolinea sp.]